MSAPPGTVVEGPSLAKRNPPYVAMSWTGLTLVVPLCGAALAVLTRRRASFARASSLLASLATLGLCLYLWARFDPTRPGYQFVSSLAWTPRLGASFVVGVDGVSLCFIVLTALLAPLVLLAGGQAPSKPSWAYPSTVLVLETALLGAFVSIDALLFYTFWVVAGLCLGPLTGMGGGPRAQRAVVGVWTSTLGASVLLLGALAVCHHIHEAQTGSPSFDARHWAGLVLTPGTETRLFLVTFVAFALVTPLFPLQAWLLRSIEGAPPAGKAFVCALSVKLGAYGMLRFAVPWFPRAAHTYAPVIVTLALVSLLYGAAGAVLASRFTTLLARITMAYMGLAVAGIFTLDEEALRGALLLMIGHGLLIAALFFLAGRVRSALGTEALVELGGLRCTMPKGVMLLGFLSALGIAWPVVVARHAMGAAGRFGTLLAGAGLLLLAVSFFRVLRPALRGSSSRPRSDLRWRDALVILPLVAGLLWLGLQPGRLLRGVGPAAAGFVSRVSGAKLLTE